MIRLIFLYVLAISFILTPVINVMGQKKTIKAEYSVLAEIPLPSEALQEKRLLYTAAAKTVLEMETSKYQINITDIEVFSFLNIPGNDENKGAFADNLIKSLEDSGYECWPAEDNPLITWLSKNDKQIVMYLSSTKKETALYFGKVSNLSPSFNRTFAVTSNQYHPALSEKLTVVNKNLIGNWGNLSGSKVSYQDGSTGYMVVSGQSTGFGLELRQDGSFLQSTVVTSGRPNYRIFVSTTGDYTVKDDQLIFVPLDRHYRKWENEIIMTDEHSLPEAYTLYWSISKNEITGKECLYIRFEDERQSRELCRE